VRTIVVGVDGSPESRKAVAWAADLAAETGARIVAVHAVGLLESDRIDPGGSHLAPELEQWTAALDGIAAERVERRLVPGDPVDVLHAAALDLGAEMVVVGSRGVGSHPAASLGSTSLHLAEAGAVTLVIVPPDPA
jgi:nucleotide-binding universal stress UspA family protein